MVAGSRRRRELAAWLAVGFSVAEAEQWFAVSAAPGLARAFREYGFETAEGVRWAAVGLGPDRAAEWRARSVPPAEAARWAGAGFDAETSAGYVGFGFEPEEASRWQVWLAEVVEEVWEEPGMVARLASAWRAVGFGPEDAAAWLGVMVRVARPGGWEVVRVSGGLLVSVADLFGEAEVAVPVEAAWCKQAGLSPVEAAACRMGGWLPPLERLRAAAPSPSEAVRLRELGGALVARTPVSSAGVEVGWLVRALDGAGSLGGGPGVDWLARVDRNQAVPDVGIN